MEGTGPSFVVMAAFVMSYGLLVMLPGPNMALAVRAGLTMSHADRMKTVVGIALGASVLVTITALPTIVFPFDGRVRGAFAIAAGLLLIGLGLRILLTSTMASHKATPGKAGSGFGIAFVTACSNPTTAIYFASSNISAEALPTAFRVVSIAMIVFAIAAAWFSLVSWTLSTVSSRLHSSRYRRTIDIGAAMLLMGFGVFTMLSPG